MGWKTLVLTTVLVYGVLVLSTQYVLSTVLVQYKYSSTRTEYASTQYESHAPHISFFDSASILMKFSFVLEI